jgi:hypothetical protein
VKAAFGVLLAIVVVLLGVRAVPYATSPTGRCMLGSSQAF